MISSATEKKTLATSIHSGAEQTEILIGDDVLDLLQDARFLEQWDQLYNACPWATVFLHRSFVATWYKLYSNEFLPILVKSVYADQLTGLVTLGKSKDGLITGAGAHLAEYQGWLIEDGNDESFIKNALLEVNRHFPENRIQFKYILPGVSFSFAEKDPKWKKRSFIKRSRQPLMAIDDAHLTSELKKKNRREKVNRLKRLGELKFERITDYAAFEAAIDEMALQSDFRKGAVYNKVSFKADPLRKKFLLALFRLNILHVTVIKIGDKIISSNVSTKGNGQIHLQGINSFNAAYAKHSPGILHFLMLGKLLVEEGEGYPFFDLTPGGDAYKAILATEYSVGYVLSVGSKYHGVKKRMRIRLNIAVTKAAAAFGVKPAELKKTKNTFGIQLRKLTHAARQGVSSLFAFLGHVLKKEKKTLKCWVAQNRAAASGLVSIQKDDINDLLSYDKQDVRYNLQEFLSNATGRIEEGGHCYTWAENGQLLGCAWVTSQPSATPENEFGITDGFIITLYNVYCHPNYGNKFPHFLQSIANELAVDNLHEKMYIVTDSNDDRLFKKAGWQQLK